ncbi:hypothetical protein [Rhodoferax sp.]|jgi:hypothetical protein|nr:hypothetical protein [Rhodoferax sp.]MDP3865930.1 hypothetical protein [Rhodoferax sp.]
MEPVSYEEAKPKTKRISIHTSGVVNVHDTASPTRIFIPCLLDLNAPILVVGYVVPKIDALDITEVGKGDHVIVFPDENSGPVAFEFHAVPATAPTLPGEHWRLIVEGRYGVVCTLVDPATVARPHGTPANAFSTYQLGSVLAVPAIQEEQAFIRFQQLMHANQVLQALKHSAVSEDLHSQIVQRSIEQGRGIQGPNAEGVWEIVCNVPMRIRPNLIVNFADPERYIAAMIDLRKGDNRLNKVRVRFTVYDQKMKRFMKTPVEIVSVFLDAEL